MVSESEVPMGPDFGEIEMYANANVMRMPTNYVDMNADEIEYDGGWKWWKVAAAIGVAALAVVAAPVACAYVGYYAGIYLGSTAVVATAGNFAADAALGSLYEWGAS